jgi:phage tail-like protein
MLPISAFNFEVYLRLPGEKGLICDAGFSECDGLEMSVAPKTIREGGNNGQMIHLPGPVSYGQLSLKRGMSQSYDLWNWFERCRMERGLRAAGQVLVLGSDRAPKLRFELTGCLPIKLKAPALNAKDGQIAIEEMQIAYETLSLARATGSA